MISMMSFIIIVLLILQLAVSYQCLYNIKNHKYNNYIQYANRETITSLSLEILQKILGRLSDIPLKKFSNCIKLYIYIYEKISKQKKLITDNNL